MTHFNFIKAEIRKFAPELLLYKCIEALDYLQKNKIKNQATWNIIVLMKWILFYGSQESSNTPTHEDLDNMLKLIEKFELEREVISFRSTKEIKRSIRIVAYQQFWLQDKITSESFSRQIQLYKLLPNKNEIEKTFIAETGFSIPGFLNICYSIFLYYECTGDDYDGFLFDDYFDIFKERFDHENLKRFAILLTLLYVEDVASLQKSSKKIYQLYETNFLSTKPFFNVNNWPKTPHKAVFGQTCKHFIYDYLKLKSGPFSNQFGRSMEKYIRLGLDEIKATYIMEKAIQKKYTGKTFSSDFFVGNNVLIESKAIELQPNAAVLRYTEVLSNALEENVIKAYCQLLNTAHHINPDQVFYGIVITYKEMYHGFGLDAWEEFLRERVEVYLNENKVNLKVLPPENLCFIDLETWDYLIQALKTHKCSVSEIFEKAKSENEHHITRKMLMDQVLREHFTVESFDLTYLTEGRKYIDIEKPEKC
jgi:hypothetical protein